MRVCKENILRIQMKISITRKIEIFVFQSPLTTEALNMIKWPHLSFKYQDIYIQSWTTKEQLNSRTNQNFPPFKLTPLHNHTSDTVNNYTGTHQWIKYSVSTNLANQCFQVVRLIATNRPYRSLVTDLGVPRRSARSESWSSD
jgi:hypothetical protein